MAETMGDAARNGLESFIGMLAVLSLGVGILNLFPIPVLDGGHLVFHAYEAVTLRPPSDRALQGDDEHRPCRDHPVADGLRPDQRYRLRLTGRFRAARSSNSRPAAFRLTTTTCGKVIHS